MPLIPGSDTIGRIIGQKRKTRRTTLDANCQGKSSSSSSCRSSTPQFQTCTKQLPSLTKAQSLIDRQARLFKYRRSIKMASRLLPRFSALSSRSLILPIRTPSRSFQTSSRHLQEVVAAAPVRKPVGAFRGGSVALLISLRKRKSFLPTMPNTVCSDTLLPEQELTAYIFADFSVSYSVRPLRAPRCTTTSWKNTRSRMRC